MTDGRALRVAFDGHWWLTGPPSGRNVVIGLVSAWSREYAQDRISLLVRREQMDAVSADLRDRGIEAALRPSGPIARIHALAARAAGRSARDQDAVITQNFATRTRGPVSGVLVHDAMYVEHPDWFTRRERAYLSLLRPSLRSADVIFTTSMTETQRVGRVWPETRARLVPIGLDVPVDLSRATPRRPSTLPDDVPYALVVGRLNVRKNIARLIEAFDASLRERYRLLVVGSPDGMSEQLESGSDDRVLFLRDIGDPELRWLYEHAAVSVMPSLDEGFGLPLLEARAAGSPTIASDIPVFREIGADAYFDPRSTSELRRVLLDTLGGVGRGTRTVRSDGTWTEVVTRMRDGIIAAKRGGRLRVPTA